MGIPSFTRGYPPNGSTLGNTKSTIRNNLDGTFLAFSIDHRDQNESNPGYHDLIHQQTQTSVNTVAGINQVFSGVPGALSVNSVLTPAIPNNGDVQLYSLTGAGKLSQLTGNLASTEGFCWVGGILIQWGTVNPTTAVSGTVTFSSPSRPNCAAFPHNCFSVVATAKSSSTSSTIIISTFAASNFVWRKSDASNVGLTWVAIGN